eukprot:comp24106_c2_seq1/m.43598 comp24106_c2_seq1/g.43598  ORF comp24106_c2_seq1/g.43598 comp24106_c2_seq1/m.43598 type:complete len:197 (+) comp24106_c2_seq1:231-821(+)
MSFFMCVCTCSLLRPRPPHGTCSSKPLHSFFTGCKRVAPFSHAGASLLGRLCVHLLFVCCLHLPVFVCVQGWSHGHSEDSNGHAAHYQPHDHGVACAGTGKERHPGVCVCLCLCVCVVCVFVNVCKCMSVRVVCARDNAIMFLRTYTPIKPTVELLTDTLLRLPRTYHYYSFTVRHLYLLAMALEKKENPLTCQIM